MAYNKDEFLGQVIHKVLLANGVESPVFFDKVNSRTELIQEKIKDILELLGLDLSNASIIDSPKRIAKFFINELFYGLNYKNFPCITTTPNEYSYHNPIFSQGIEFNSTCEHHLVTILGKAYIAYIPKEKVIGLSKINRVVDFFAKRPQVQERATRQIFFALQNILDTPDIAVGINAKHHCIVIRGVRNENTDNITVEFGGQFKEKPHLQNNLYNLIK